MTSSNFGIRSSPVITATLSGSPASLNPLPDRAAAGLGVHAARITDQLDA